MSKADELGQKMDGGFLPLLPPNASSEEQTAVLNEIIDRLNEQLQRQIFADDTTRRMLIGFQENGWGQGKHFGIKVSLPGVDVLEAEDNQLMFRMTIDEWAWRNDKGQLVKKFSVAEGRDDYFDPNDERNYMRAGILPDNTGGWLVSRTGEEIDDAF